MDEGYAADLYSGGEWPKVSAVAETRAEKRTRTAKILNRDLGESLKQAGKSGAVGAAKSQPAILELSAQDCQYDSGERLKTDPYAYCRTFGRGTHSCKDEGLDLLVSETSTERFVGAVAKDETDGRYRVMAVVDSGAEESVAPPGCSPGMIVPCRMSKSGGKYRAANGARIPNLGQVKVPFVNEDGVKCGIMFQVAEVERPLISATQLAASGDAVIIDGKGAKIVNTKTRKVMKLVKRGGVYVLRLRVKADPAPGVPGPGR
jgi:hypothetical protein